MSSIFFSFLCLVFVTCVLAGYPSTPQDTTTVQVPGKYGITITYKETTICETRSCGFAGYVNLPAASLSDVQPGEPYNISVFFWYFPARKQSRNAQTAIYLAGGPGQSSMYGAVRGGGPCTILPDSNNTQSNPYSWNEYANMLYVDQPVGAGYSYDALVNSTMNLLGRPDIKPMQDYEDSIPAENQTLLYGTFGSQNSNRTAPNSAIAARTLWHFSQAWFRGFPEYRTQDKRVSLWGNSYGGYFVPTSAEHFERQNVKIRTGEIPDGYILEVDTIGWSNGCSDILHQADRYPDMAYNNTYGLQIISTDAFETAKNEYSKAGGCRDQVLQCREAGELHDPDQLGFDSDVNEACVQAFLYCASFVVQGPYLEAGNRSIYDMAHFNLDSYPPQYLVGFFNRGWVQRELGTPVNFTALSYNVLDNFQWATGDYVRTSGMKSIEYLLKSGVKVAMMYGDRDFSCNWLGGEQLSLQANWTGAPAFRDAGYETLKTSPCHNGGVVRQHGNLSFARVFDSGHDVASYQPQTAYEIFTRAMLNLDIATGKQTTSGAANNYSSRGPLSSLGWKNSLPTPPLVDCNLYNIAQSCTVDQVTALKNGSATVADFNVARIEGDTSGAYGETLV